MVSPFDLSGTLLVGGGLLVLCYLAGPPVVKQLMQMVSRGLARVGGFSQCASPKTPKEFRFLILRPTQTGQQEPSTLDPPVTLDLACLFFHLSISRSQMYYLAFSNNG